MGSYKDLIVFKKAYSLALDIFKKSRSFPREEKFSLTDQIRRSSRSVCANIGEAYRRKKYPAHFVSKLTDSNAENTETEIWIRFSNDFKYLNEFEYKDFSQRCEEVGRKLGLMIDHPEKFCK